MSVSVRPQFTRDVANITDRLAESSSRAALHFRERVSETVDRTLQQKNPVVQGHRHLVGLFLYSRWEEKNNPAFFPWRKLLRCSHSHLVQVLQQVGRILVGSIGARAFEFVLAVAAREQADSERPGPARG